MGTTPSGAHLAGCVLVAHHDLVRGGELARACHCEGLTPLMAFSGEEVLAVVGLCELDAVLLSTRLPGHAPGGLVAGVRRHTAALVILLGGTEAAPHHVDLRLDGDAPAASVARSARSLVDAAPPQRPWLRWGPLLVDATLRQAWWDHVPLPLTEQQFLLLRRLVDAQGGVVTVAELAQAVYGGSSWHDTERIHAHVLRLRRRLAAVDHEAAGAVRTVRGAGFRLQEPLLAGGGGAADCQGRAQV